MSRFPDGYEAFSFGLKKEDMHVLDDSSVSSSHQLDNIEEDLPMYWPSPTNNLPPETPLEPMEFLSRRWSISAIDVSRALAPYSNGNRNDSNTRASTNQTERKGLETTPFTFASTLTSQMVMDRILTPVEPSICTPRRNFRCSGPLGNQHSGPLSSSPPISPRQGGDELQSCRGLIPAKVPGRGASMKRWFKDIKERKKESARAHNAQVHAAVSIAGVAAAIAAVAAATAASAIDDGGVKTSMAVASAASLVASQCVEVAESLGADHDQVSSVVSSAVSVKTAGDIMTLTAAAATALRGAATLRARMAATSHASVAPVDRRASNIYNFSGDLRSEDSDTESYTQELLAKGTELIKRSKKGKLHYRQVSVYINKHGQVMLKLRSKYVGGKLKKKKKSIILDLYADVPAWPGRCLLDNGEQRRYFGLKTAAGVVEFECKSIHEHKVWTEGILMLLNLAAHRAK